jgi:hypothetical protein
MTKNIIVLIFITLIAVLTFWNNKVVSDNIKLTDERIALLETRTAQLELRAFKNDCKDSILSKSIENLNAYQKGIIQQFETQSVIDKKQNELTFGILERQWQQENTILLR